MTVRSTCCIISTALLLEIVTPLVKCVEGILSETYGDAESEVGGCVQTTVPQGSVF